MIEARGLAQHGQPQPIDLRRRAGEVLGVGGLLGSGRTALARRLFGLAAADAGELHVDSVAVTLHKPADAVALGVVALAIRVAHGTQFGRTVYAIGGRLLSGGIGYVAGTLVGVLTLGIIQTLITVDGSLRSWWTRIIIGALLFAFCLLQRVFESRAAARATVGA